MVLAFDELLRRSGLLFVLQVVNVGLAYATQVLLARWLGIAQFGVFTYAWAWAALLAIPAGLGLSTAVLRFIPAYMSESDEARVHGIVRWSARAVSIGGLLLAAAGGAFLLLAHNLIPAHYQNALWFALAAVPLLALSTLRINHGNAFGRPAAVYGFWVIGSNIGLLLGAAAVLRLRGTLSAQGVLGVAVVVLALTVAAQTRRVAKLFRPSSLARLDVSMWLRVSGPLLASSLLYVLLERTDVLLVGTLLGPEQAGIYGAAARTALLVSFSGIAITTIATPRIPALHASGDRHRLQHFATRIRRWTFWPASIAALVLIVAGGPILSLYGQPFRAGWPCLALLAAAQVAPAAAGLAPHLLNMTGHQLAGAGAMGLSLLVNAGLALILIPRIGIMGAAIASSSGLVVRSAAHTMLAHRRLGVRPLAPVAQAGS